MHEHVHRYAIFMLLDVDLLHSAPPRASGPLHSAVLAPRLPHFTSSRRNFLVLFDTNLTFVLSSKLVHSSKTNFSLKLSTLPINKTIIELGGGKSLTFGKLLLRWRSSRNIKHIHSGSCCELIKVDVNVSSHNKTFNLRDSVAVKV